jgi:hypothetical protein
MVFKVFSVHENNISNFSGYEYWYEEKNSLDFIYSVLNSIKEVYQSIIQQTDEQTTETSDASDKPQPVTPASSNN